LGYFRNFERGPVTDAQIARVRERAAINRRSWSPGALSGSASQL